ncbi:MAG: hypothetical protein IKX44_01850 [Prevotella sp.]|nr:hypothetical protein [Prevotella sp.]
MRKRFTLALLSLLMVPLAMMAQNVTISPTTGSLMAALTSGTEVGFENGWSAMWRHEQLPLTFTVADQATLTDGGEIANPAGNIREYQKNNTVGNKLVLAGGVPYDGYMVLSLPKGYRITGYRMVLLNNLNGTTVEGINAGTQDKVIYETASNFNYNNAFAQTPVMGGTNSDTEEYVIERTSLSEGDMGNQLYFRLVHDHSAFFLVTIKSFEVYFTAEGTFEADVKPDDVGQARSVVTAPFTTSKIDIGDMKLETKNGKTFFAYNYNNVRDLVGYTYLYQDDAIEDGVPSDVAEEKHIYPVKVDNRNLYALCNDTYYIETPIQVHTQTGLESPVGYRIVGATFNYLWGSATEGHTEVIPTTCTIYYTRNGSTLYLNDQLQFTTTLYNWTIDDVGNIVTAAGTQYLACSGSNDDRSLTLSQLKDNQYNLRRDDNGRIYYKSSSSYYYLQYYNGTYQRTQNGRDWYRWDNNNASYTPKVVKSTNVYDENDYIEVTVLFIFTHREYGCYRSDYLATSDLNTGTITEYPGFNPGSYTLTIYDKTGNATAKTVTVNSASNTGSYHLTGLNNDAVKFSISGLAEDDPDTEEDEGKQALVSVTLELQALDPYIDKMDIVCHDAENQLSLSQSFTADDFSVSGGKFVFYIPSEYQDTELTFTFSDLWSKYGDDTYYYDRPELQKNGNGRYSFVTSSYFEPINGNGNDGLYATAYNPNTPYTNKVFTSTAGNIRFKFNNAEDLSNTGTGTGYLEEKAFSVASYLASFDPDAADGETPAQGEFINCKLHAKDNKSGIYYVFTADETRYNIAPTTAWQHRSYAFYRMDIELQAKTYTPDPDWTEIYKNTSYADVNDQNKAIDQDKPMWGLKLATKDSQTGAAVTGYLTVKEIDDAITAALTASGGPTTADQILYIDASDLYSVVNSHELSLAQLKAKLSPNALIYLPENTTSTLDNFAYMTGSGAFRAGKDIVITDKKPFFAPYDIQVDAANYAKYDRKITWQSQGKNTLQTVLLPFTIDVSGGTHTEEDNTAFTLNKMVADNCLSIDHKEDANAENFYAKAHFTPITESVSEANVPYMVQVTTAPSDSQTPFTVSQKGATVKASVLPDAHKDDYLWEGEAASGTINSTSYSFQNYGSYSGKSLTAADGYFYYAGGMYLNSKNIRPEVSKVLVVYPFRAYFAYTADPGAKRMGFMEIVFGENETSGIDALERRVSIDENAPVYDMQGRMIAPAMRDLAGKKLPRGIYVVNGVKIIVK